MTIRIAGYAAVFDVPDKGRDVVRRGAFERVQPGAPLLWQHDATRPIGRVETVNEDGRGLRVQPRPAARSGRPLSRAICGAGRWPGLS